MIVGRGATVLLIDDPITSAEAADSQVQRDGIWEWYIANALNRLAPGGGVLGIMCMTGDTPVLMADGTERRLDTLAGGDAIATYERGTLSTSTVRGLRPNGRDSVLRITMSSGRIVRANGRHPFLATINGELKWIRAKNLSTANKIVTLPVNGGSGDVLPVSSKDVKKRSCAEDTANHITQKSVGQMVTGGHLTSTLTKYEIENSSIYTESPQLSTTLCTQNKKAVAQSAENHKQLQNQNEGTKNSQSTTVTTREKYEDYCASLVILESDNLKLSPWHVPLPIISDFILDDVVSIEACGVEEVFDLSVERTENFIANGLVSHNTHWNEDDWAGRIQMMSEMDDGGDKFEIVRYPAVNEEGDEYILPDESIEQFPPGIAPPEGSRMTRPMNTPLHPERYTMDMLMNTKATYYALGTQRWWSALYQQNPSPEDGLFFTKEMVKYGDFERRSTYNVYQAWDFAITEKQQSDWTSCTTMFHLPDGSLIVHDVTRFKSNDGESLVDRMLDAYEQHQPNFIGMEDGQIWKALKSTFTRRCQERRLYPAYDILVPLTDKFVRAGPLKGLMQSGRVYIQSDRPWVKDFVDEMLKFGAAKHDDMVDSTAWCVRVALEHQPQRVATARSKLPSWRERLKNLGHEDAGHMAA
jgi:predicted phage terminase large subunit-like protein